MRQSFEALHNTVRFLGYGRQSGLEMVDGGQLLGGVFQTESTIALSIEGLRTAKGSLQRFKGGSSSSDSLDNSTIGSIFSGYDLRYQSQA